MKKIALGVAAIAAVATAVATFAPTSGLKSGESVTPFHPSHVSGPLANSEKCFPCTFQNRPQVQVWVNGDSADNVLKIAQNLQKQTEANKGSEFKSMVVWLTDDVASSKKALKGLADKSGAKDVAMAVLSKKDEAVQAYKINLSNDVKNTVVVYKNWKVSDSMVNLKADAAGIKALNGAIAKIAK